MEKKFSNENWNDVSKIETQSTTHLEDDVGHGAVAIIRCFEFAVNPEIWKQHRPTKQELFTHHQKGIEVMLWKDGMTPMPEVSPKIVVGKKKGKYQIFVGARPMRGHMLLEKTKTLSQLAHNL